MSTTSLSEITFSEGLKSIGGYATFWYCADKNFTIPASVERLGTPFGEVEEITFLGNPPAGLGENPFSGEILPTIYYDPATTGWDITPLREIYSLIPLS